MREKAARSGLAKAKTKPRQKRGIRLDEARSIGILGTAEQAEDLGKLRAFARRLRESFGTREVQLFVFVPEKSKERPDWLAEDADTEVIFQDEVQWNFSPKVISAAAERRYDVLIDGTDGECLPLCWLLAHSPSAMKVSRHETTASTVADLTLDVSRTMDFKAYTQQLENYLTQLTFA